MDGTLDFDCYSLGSNNLNNFTPTQSIFVKLSRDVKVNIMVNIYICNGLGQNVENLGSFHLSEIVERGQNPKFVKYGHV